MPIRTGARRRAVVVMSTVFLACGAALAAAPTTDDSAPYRSPFEVAFSPDGRMLAVSDRTARRLTVVDVSAARVAREIALDSAPTGLVWAADGASIFVAEHATGTVARSDPMTGKVLSRFDVGPRPMGLALVKGRQHLIVANEAIDAVTVLDLARNERLARIDVPRRPLFLAVTPDESLCLVTNHLPAGLATDVTTAAVVSLIDLNTLTHVGDIKLPPGSSVVRKIAVSPDGRWAYVVHTVGRFNVPTTQLERGWVNTNAFSIIDLAKRTLHATLLLDNLAQGAADPWGVVVAPDGNTLWITLAGVHQLARVDLGGLHELLEGKLDGRPRLVTDARYSAGDRSIWQQIHDDPARRADLVNDLTALHAARLIKRTALPGKGPRGLDVSPDGKTLAAAIYFSGQVAMIDAETSAVTTTVPLGPSPAPDLARQGEIIFHDATVAFQHWLSCSTCHPGGRVDGLNWDLVNDGLGNPKNVKSLLWSHRTPPLTARGILADLDACLPAEFRKILFRPLAPERLAAVGAYIRSLEPEPSPYRQANGELSEAAVRGKRTFESERAKCSTCHPAPLFTSKKMEGVGSRGAFDHAAAFDVPSLVEVRRTAPYYHDGSVRTLRDVVTTANPDDAHGVTSHLTPEQIDDLVAYLSSL